MKSRLLYWSLVVGGVVLAAFFLSWSIQTAWLGSFPGRDVHAYTRHFYWQLGMCLAFLVLALFVGVRYRRRKSGLRDE